MTHLVRAIRGLSETEKFPSFKRRSTPLISLCLNRMIQVKKQKRKEENFRERFPWKCRKRKNHITRKLNSFIFTTLSLRLHLCECVLKICFHFELIAFLWKNHPITLSCMSLHTPFIDNWIFFYCVDDVIERIQNYSLRSASFVSFLIYLNLYLWT